MIQTYSIELEERLKEANRRIAELEAALMELAHLDGSPRWCNEWRDIDNNGHHPVCLEIRSALAHQDKGDK